MGRTTSKTVASTDIAEAKASGSQTLLRGLDLLEAVGSGITDINDIAAHIGLTRSTTYRLAAALAERRYLAVAPRLGYRLGSKILDLGALAHQQTDLIQIARPTLEGLAEATLDTVHLGVLDGDRALYLDKIPGKRRIEISSRVGERQPLNSTGLGKALLLDDDAATWDQVLDHERVSVAREIWHRRMVEYQRAGRTFDLEENEDRIRCVAAPIREASGKIVAAISLSSATQYMDDERMNDLSETVRQAARTISNELGWNEHARRSPRKVNKTSEA